MREIMTDDARVGHFGLGLCDMAMLTVLINPVLTRAGNYTRNRQVHLCSIAVAVLGW